MDGNLMLFDITPFIKKPINGIIQIGAHLGNEYENLKQISPNFLMFEPQKKIYEKLNQKLGSNKNVTIVNAALGSEKKKEVMYTEQVNQGQSSSILPPALHLLQYPTIQFNDAEEVDVISLDEYIKQNPNNYNLMTLDVQGYELEVLKGCKLVLKQVDYILCEVNRAELYQGCPMVEEIDEYLKDYNFKREITSWDGHTWGDAFYIKQ
jgi:FkbM family methyltransferase